MKKSLLCGALLTIMGSPIYGDTALPGLSDPQLNQQPAATSSTVTVEPSTTAPAAAPVINCDYKLDATVKNVDPALILKWSEKASTQAFDFEPATLDTQIQSLKACFTEQGWTGFNTALQKSGNLEAIKAQKLNVSSQLDGQAKIVETKENQWKVNLPLQVVYQNDKEKVTQLLDINLTVGRKVNGDLGVMQMIATPRAAINTAEHPADPAVPAQVSPTPEDSPADLTSKPPAVATPSSKDGPTTPPTSPTVPTPTPPTVPTPTAP